jgi:phosphoribosylpyrophosphate synthetase
MGDISMAAAEWEPGCPPRYESLVSVDSQGWQACELWRREIGRYAEIAKYGGYAVIYTGIGGAIAGVVEANGVARFGDGSRVYPKVNLDRLKVNGKLPTVVFPIVSAVGTDELTSLLTASDEFKEEGAEVVVPVLTGLAHERQDHTFTSADGTPINQLTTLKGVINILAGAQKLGIIDGAVGVGLHSLRPVELSLRRGFPLIPIDTFEFMVQEARLDQIINPFALGPDKGRYDICERLAARLGCPRACAKKVRAREEYGDPTISIPQEVLDYMADHECTAITADDELREGGTADRLRMAVDGYALKFVFVTMKTFMANASNGREDAVGRLNRPLEHGFPRGEHFYFANAVSPQIDTEPIEHKITWLDMRPNLEAMIEWLANNLDQPAGPGGSGIYPGTLFNVDLHLETYK